MSVNKEQAQRILSKNSDSISCEYFQAIVDEKLPFYYLQTLEMRRKCSDETPQDKLVDLWHPSYPFMKCRGNYICGLSATLQSCVRDEVIKDPKVIQLIETYRHKKWNFQTGKLGEVWTSRDEIDYINLVLEKVTGYLKQKYGLEVDLVEIEQKYRTLLTDERARFGV